MFEKLKQFSIGNLTINTKLLLLAFLPILGLLYLTIVTIGERWSDLQEANQLESLVEFLENVGDFTHATQAERGLSALFIASEGAAFGPSLETQRIRSDVTARELRASIEKLRADNLPSIFYERVDTAVGDLDRLGEFRSRVDRFEIDRLELLDFYTRMNLEFFDAVLTIPSFSRDPQIATSINALGAFLFEKDVAGEERAWISDILRQGRFTGDAFARVVALVEKQEVFASVFASFATPAERRAHDLIVADPAIIEASRLRDSILDKHTKFGNEIPIDFGLTPEEWFAVATTKLNALKAVESAVSVQVREIATANAAAARSELIFFVITLAVLSTVTVALAIYIGRGVVRQVDNLIDLFSEIGIGNFAARAEIMSNDELGQMTTNLNIMLDNLTTLVQTQEERDRIQAAIQKLLEEVAGVAEGDLTSEAEVTTEVTGAIADSFNFMIGQLREIIRNVQVATIEVSVSANEISNTAAALSQGSEAQALQIVDTTVAVDEMSVSIQQVSESAARSTEVAALALANARQGTQVVQETVGSMNRIREQVQQTAERITRLGESSQRIGEIVRLIHDIADRTSILALNASIQAALAGEAGRGFAAVAEEVEQLADQATEATRQITTIVEAIQSDTNETVTAMAMSRREVETGSHLADQAGQALAEIEDISNQLAELIQSISMSAQQQARGSEAVAQSMNEIAGVTQQTAQGTKQAATEINQLATLADNLRSSVSAFKLSGRNGNDRLN